VISLEPLTVEVCAAVLSYAELPVPHAPDWPHADTYDAFRMFSGLPGTFLVMEDGVVVGDCGWFGPDEQVEIGYGLAPSARGRGIGLEAVRQLVDWVASQGAGSVRGEVLPGNEPSLRLLTRLGFVLEEERAGHLVLVKQLR
jgi:RimJ/RimL family protein N-acetyltransferase